MFVGAGNPDMNLCVIVSHPLLLQPHLEKFVCVWEELDPHATGFIHINHLGILLEELPPPLGVKVWQLWEIICTGMRVLCGSPAAYVLVT